MTLPLFFTAGAPISRGCTVIVKITTPDRSHENSCMSSAPASQTQGEPGQLLHELEKRQDDVLTQLDDLDAKLTEVLKGLGVTAAEESEELGAGSEE